MKNVVVVSSSLRAKSSSRVLTKEVVKGLKENNNVELIELSKMNYSFCKGCLTCQKSGKCVIDDDVKKVIKKINDADILVFATPIYFYSIAGQLKTFLDRLNPLYVSETRKFKFVYPIFTCADDNHSAVDGPLMAIKGWVDCFEGVELGTSFNGIGINSVNDISEKIKQEAYLFGKAIK